MLTDAINFMGQLGVLICITLVLVVARVSLLVAGLFLLWAEYKDKN